MWLVHTRPTSYSPNMFTQFRTSAFSALGLRPMSPFSSPRLNWSVSVGESSMPTESIMNSTLVRSSGGSALYSFMNSDTVLATSSIIAMLSFRSLSSLVSTPRACSQDSSRAFSESISTTKIPCSWAWRTRLPEQM